MDDLLKPISEDQVRKMLKVYQELQAKLNCKLGGSLALYLHGIIDLRYFKDIDVIMQPADYNKYRDTLSFTGQEDVFSSDAKHKQCIQNVDVDFFTNSNSNYTIITFEGVSYKVTTIREIFEARLSYGLHHKHLPETLEICSRAVKEIPGWQKGSWNKLSKPRSCF